MTQQPVDTTGRSYRTAFLLACAAIVVLAIGIAALAWRLHRQTAPPVPPPSTAAAAGTTTTPKSDEALITSAAPPLAPIQLSPQRMQSIGVQIGRVADRVVNDDLRLTGTVEVNERRVSYVQSRVAGWIRDVRVDATGDLVRQGQTLFTIYSPDLAATEREYLLAKKNASELAHSPVAGVAAGAASLLDAARERLRQWQIAPAEIARLDASGEVSNALAIDAPASGYVTEKHAVPNLYVQPDTKLYTIADLSDIWVVAQVFQNDAGKIRPGDRARVTVDAYPGVTFAGGVDDVLPQMDAATRTLPVRLVFSNPGLRLRPGMYVNVTIALPLGRHLVVPAAAVFHSGTRSLVFAYGGDGRITPKEIEVGPRVGDEQIVLEGIDANAPIVTSANFLIDSEAQLQAAAGAFAPPPTAAGGTTETSRPAVAPAAIDMTTDPSPPRKGQNTVRVRLTGADGRGMAGTEVTVTFFMPAMPAMGMAAMKTVVAAADKGGGLYEGSVVLSSGGTWQVTMTAVHDGQTMATRQLSVTATGGM
ncbi:MAG TPA: efflux RND transporter periplasmic adaptor subunit [Vicinamibacterales bacterium]|jgi:Cu(I)/Ag(I) efflux system membrane fusion protein/cobalt-zinc-cadmium efflux system membrane fusion protein|nr:efflux RND transporter periplasmic adaptor subunit [Vicinamibacterales bacterium]